MVNKIIINQEVAIKHNLSSEEAIIVGYFAFKEYGGFTDDGEDSYWWMSIRAINEKLPVLGISRSTMRKRVKSLIEKNILQKYDDIHEQMTCGGYRVAPEIKREWKRA